jgi:predicted MFS family arabinose efflux permease
VVLTIPETSRQRQPLRMKQLAKNYSLIAKDFTLLRSILGLGLAFSIINTFNTLGPFLIQVDLQHSPLFYAHIALLIGALGFLGGITNRYLMKRFSLEAIIRFCVLSMVAVSIFSFIFSAWLHLSIWTIVLPAALMIFVALMIYPNFSANCSSMFKEMAGTAAAYRGIISMTFAALLMAVMSSLHNPGIFKYLACYLILSIALLVVEKLHAKKSIIRKKN